MSAPNGYHRFGIGAGWQGYHNTPNQNQNQQNPNPNQNQIFGQPPVFNPNMNSPTSISSVGSPQGGPSSGGRQHQRTYQACIPCRKRKVKCDLGPVDNPHKPPCQRCRRENKECLFSRQRRRNKDGDEDEEEDEYEIAASGGRRRRGAGTPSGNNYRAENNYRPGVHGDFNRDDLPMVPGALMNRDPTTPVRRRNVSMDDEDNNLNNNNNLTSPLGNQSTMLLQTSPVYSQTNALELLYHAAHEQYRQVGSGAQDGRVVTPNARGTNQTNSNLLPLQPSDPVVRVWSRLRFVRSGWFRIEEGIAYVQYFYENLYPLTPLTIPNYSDVQAMPDLLEEEPMLALTILTIASRYMPLDGADGPMRAQYIHQQLNNSMHKEIQRTIWGQKQFGGGICRAGARSPDKVNHLWQTLGFIEALMLLTEWHPRAMHFPPDDDDGELLIPENPGLGTQAMMDAPVRLGGPEGRRVDSWLEPCWRSDRMCWILLSIADALAVEIGVYEHTTEIEFRMQNPNLSDAKVLSYFTRKNHLKELIPLFKAQTSGRLELTANHPMGKSLLGDVQNLRPEQRLLHRIKKLGLEHQLASMPTNANFQDLLSILNPLPQEIVTHFWAEATIMLDNGNHTLYHSRKHTNALIESGKYTEQILDYKQWLASWITNFNACEAIPDAMRHIIRIEYEYSRAFLCALALQAVVQRCVRNTPLHRFAELASTGQDGDQASGSEANPFTPADFRKWVGSDNVQIKECIDACRSIFRVIIDAPGPYLKHCPVRTYFRIISAALLLIKTFIIGATEDDMATTLGLLDKAMLKLRNHIVDSVHVGNRFADMLVTLTEAARGRFIRLNREGNGSATSRAETPGLNNHRVGQTTLAPPTNGHLPSQFVQQNGASIAGGSGSGRNTPHNSALWGITNHVFAPPIGDATSFMPPPSSYYMTDGFHPTGSGNINGTTGAVDSFNGMGQLQDWITLPYGDLMGAGGELTIGPNGPNIGGDDILDRILYSGLGGHT